MSLAAVIYLYLFLTSQIVARMHCPQCRPILSPLVDFSPAIDDCLKVIQQIRAFSRTDIPNIWSARNPKLPPTTSLVWRRLPLQLYEGACTMEIQPTIGDAHGIFPSKLIDIGYTAVS